MAKAVKESDDTQNSDEALVNRWLKEIELVQESNDQQVFERRGLRINKKYKNDVKTANFDPDRSSRVEYNVLWANCQVLEPALFSRIPKVVGERIFKDHDPVGRFAAELAERATQFNILTQQDKFRYNVKLCVKDRLLPGRGQGWLTYKADFEDAVDEMGNPILDDEGEPVKVTKPNSERVEFDYVNWLDYYESKARTQYEVRWRCRKLYFTREEAEEEFGEEIGSKLNFDSNPYEKKRKNQTEEPDFLQQATVYKITDLTSKECLYISPGYRSGPLKRAKDPLKLKDFWECPIPLLATTTSDSTYPTPDYIIYEALANELDYIVQRLGAMTDCIRLVGLVASQHNKDIKEMLRLQDGQLQPINGWQAFVDKGGLGAMVSWLPFDAAVAAIPVLEQRFVTVKSQIDEITSMPDIVRGSSDPNDPVYTQQQKSHWTVIKLVEKQQDVQRFCREIISKMAEIIFEPGFFSDETIRLMAGVDQMPPEKQEMFYPALELLRNDRLRTFRIDIETDSTIAIDEDQALESWAKYLDGLNNIFGNVQQVMQFRPELMKPMLEVAIEGIRQLRAGRGTEGAFEKALEEIEAADKEARENPQPPPPDPQMIRAQNESQKLQMDGQKAQADFQLEQQKLGMQGQKDQMEFQLKMGEQQFSQWLEQQQLQLDSMKVQGDIEVKHEANAIAQGKEFSRAQIDQTLADLENFKTQLEGAVKLHQQTLEDKKLEFERASNELSMQEKLLEEQRLAKESSLEAAHLQFQHQKLAHDVELQHKKLDVQERVADKKLKESKNKTMHRKSKASDS